MSKFSLSKASGAKETKRPAESAGSGTPNKVPKVSDITIEVGPKPSATPRRKPQIAPVQVCIFKYTADAGDCWETFKGDNVPLWQIQVDHNAQRSICFRLREAFEDYLRSANVTDTTLPTTVADLEKAAGIRLVIGDQKDPEDIGYVQWRTVFYVAGDLNNFLLLLDGFFVWKEKSIAQSQPFQVEIHPYIDSTEAGHVWDDLEYKEYSYNEPAKDLQHIYVVGFCGNPTPPEPSVLPPVPLGRG